MRCDRGVKGEIQVQRRRQPRQRLPEVLPACRQAAGILLHHLAVIVHPADRAKHAGDTHGDPDIGIAQIRPQQAADRDTHQDQGTTHGRGTGFAEVGLGPVAAYRLPHLVVVEPADHGRPHQQGNRQGGQGSQDAAQGQVLEHLEAGGKLGQILCDKQQHVSSRPPLMVH